MHQQHNNGMATSITIRNVPTKARNELAARAALTGRSLQEYLLAQLIELASHPDAQTVLARIRERKLRTGSQLATDSILTHREADRK